MTSKILFIRFIHLYRYTRGHFLALEAQLSATDPCSNELDMKNSNWKNFNGRGEPVIRCTLGSWSTNLEGSREGASVNRACGSGLLFSMCTSVLCFLGNNSRMKLETQPQLSACLLESSANYDYTIITITLICGMSYC